MADDWTALSLGEVCRPKQWPTISQSQMADTGYPVFGANGQIGFHTTYNHEKPTVAVTCRGASCGEVLLTPPRCYITGNAMALDDLNQEVVLPIFLTNALRHRGLGDIVTGSAQPQIIGSAIRRVDLRIPPLPEQRQIAEVLDTVDEAIRRTEQLIAKLKQVKQGLLHDLLTRGIDDNGELRDPDRHPEQFKHSPLGRIPKGWEVAPLVTRVVVKGGKRLPAGHSYAEASTGFNYLRVTDFYRRGYSVASLMPLRPETFAALGRYEIEDGQLFISIAGSLGYAGVYNAVPSVRTILTENAARLVPNAPLDPRFVAFQINDASVQAQVEVEKGTGGGVPKLALFRIEKLRLVWPSLNEQREVVARVDALAARIASEDVQVAKLRLLKNGLMEDLLTGRVRVTPLLEDAAE